MTSNHWQRLRNTLEYNPETGAWKWFVTTSSRSLKGKKTESTRTNFSKRTLISRNYICFESKVYLAACLTWYYMKGEWPSQTIDHIDRNSLNDQWSNLRDVSYSVNNQNRKFGWKRQ